MEILRDMPQINYKGITVEEAYECGAGTYLIRVMQLQEKDYEAYLEELEKAGFRKKIHDVTKNGVVRIAVFEKDERTLTATYFPTMVKSWITVSKVNLNKEWSAAELFQDVPAVEVLGLKTEEAADYGAGNYVLIGNEAEQEDYRNYLAMLEEAGYRKHVDNGNGIADAVLSAIYVKGSKVLTVTLAKKRKTLYVSACFDLPLSEHLFYNEEDVAKNKPEARTRLHMPELWWFGNSFVIQLKNGHFIISDGGFTHELGYLLDYLDTLVEEGEKPIVEAWIISHAHSDHCSILRRFVGEPEFSERLYVEGLYYNQPSDSVIALDPAVRDDVAFNIMAANHLKTTSGEQPKIYRPQTGQRYYFNDITMDVVFGQEQLAFRDYSGDLNDSSTWCMFHIEGQKMLLGGDGDKGGIKFIMDTYDREYMKIDLFSLLHHGWNVWDYFTDFCTVQSVLNTSDSKYPERRIPAINHMKESVKEWIERVDGTKVLTFPYSIGTAKRLPHFEWIYHKGQRRP